MKNVKKTRRMTMLLGLVMLLAVVLAACVNTDDVPEIMDTGYNTSGATSGTESDPNAEIPTAPGATEAPKVTDIVNVTSDTVAISGTCESGATIRISSGEQSITTTANGTYYIAQLKLESQNNLVKITAQVDGKDVSAEREVVASKNAAAEPLLNGNSVSVGVASRLYFDRMVADANGNNLYTVSELNAIRDYVNNLVTGYYRDLAGSQDVELIYVLIPNVTTVYPEIFPDGLIDEPFTTVYDQVLETLGNTEATVIDMRDVYNNLRDDATVNETYGGLYRITDSKLTDYGAYLAYRELMNAVSATFPEAAPKTESDFTWTKVTAEGGNLVDYRELNDTVINEEIVVSAPKFSLSLGMNVTGSSNIASLRDIVNGEVGDYDTFTAIDSADGINGVAERWNINTARGSNLPNALIYRDNSALGFTKILAERFERTLLNESGNFAIDLELASQYAANDKDAVDYIIVILSEENMDTAFDLALSE